MGILLSLGDAKLPHPCAAYDLTQGVAQVLRRKSNGYIKAGIVLCHAGIMNLHRFCGKISETWINKGSCYLACSVGPEIEEDDTVPILNQPVTIHHSRLEELIILASRVAVFHCDLCRLCPVARAIRQAPVGFLDPIPALGSVHGVVAAAYRRHLARAYLLEFLLQLPDIGQGT